MSSSVSDCSPTGMTSDKIRPSERSTRGPSTPPSFESRGIRRAATSLALLTAWGFASACSPGESNPTAMTSNHSHPGDYSTRDLSTIPKSEWERLARATILFGHQSVGWNIIQGIEQLAAEHEEINLNIAEIGSGETPETPGLFHFAAGRNMDPLSKLQSFRAMMSTDLGRRADLALLKFCYVDFGPEIDPAQLFQDYREAISDLKRSNAATQFIHVTAPLTIRRPPTLQNRVKDLVKVLLGRPTNPTPNVPRNRYNQLLLAEYLPVDPIFDLARVESTRSDGSRAFVSEASTEVFFMADELTDDGGHLNQLGKRRAAEELLRVLVGALATRPTRTQ